jgi:hypothetical protein
MAGLVPAISIPGERTLSAAEILGISPGMTAW